MMNKLYGVIEFSWQGWSHQQMMDEIYWDIFRYKCSTDEGDGWPFRSLCKPTGKFDASQEAIGKER